MKTAFCGLFERWTLQINVKVFFTKCSNYACLVLKIAISYIIRHSGCMCLTFRRFSLDLQSVSLPTSLDLRQEASALFLPPTTGARRAARSWAGVTIDWLCTSACVRSGRVKFGAKNGAERSPRGPSASPRFSPFPPRFLVSIRGKQTTHTHTKAALARTVCV